MNHHRFLRVVLLVIFATGTVFTGQDLKADRDALVKRLWPQKRIREAMRAVEQQRRDGLLSKGAYQKRMAMLKARLAGTYVSESLSVTDPPLNFIQNAGFEKVNRNSAKNRSRWLWWNGWSWGGDYENTWETRPEYVHSGRFSARIRCVGAKGRIGIFTPQLPAVPGAKQYQLTFWAKGEGDNMLFVNFEGGARGGLREKIGPTWKQYMVLGMPQAESSTYGVYFYHIGLGTLWLDDMKLMIRARELGKAGPEYRKAEALLNRIADGISDDWTAYTQGGERFPADGMAVMSPDKAAAMGDLNAVRRAVADHIVILQGL